jgi:predicted secreted protein
MSVRSPSSSDNRSADFVFVPFCALAQAFHAQGLVKYEWGGNLRPLLQLLLHYDVNIIQMPCLETLFHGYADGLRRAPAGRKYYDTPEFHALCTKKAEEVMSQILALRQNGYRVAAILGLEHSPSCAVDLQWPPRKGETRNGFFIQALRALLKKEGLNVPIIGINRRGMQRTIERVEEILKNGRNRPNGELSSVAPPQAPSR